MLFIKSESHFIRIKFRLIAFLFLHLRFTIYLKLGTKTCYLKVYISCYIVSILLVVLYVLPEDSLLNLLSLIYSIPVFWVKYLASCSSV